MALGAMLAAPFVFLPGSSRANNPQDDPGYYRARDIHGVDQWYQRNFGRRPVPGSVPGIPGVPGMPGQGNSVPLNEGQIFLIVAGLGLGAKMLYDRRKHVQKTAH